MAQVIGNFDALKDLTMENSWVTYDDDYAEGIAVIKQQVAKYNPAGGLVGYVLRFSVPDGYAHYIVVREEPLQLAFINVDGGLTLTNKEILKLKLEDVQRKKEREEAVTHKLFPWTTP